MIRAFIKDIGRPRLFVGLLLAAVWVPVFVVYPFLTYKQGTARNISVETILEPYSESPVLYYRWTGDVYRSCDISLRRHVVDSQGYSHSLIESSLVPAQPRGDLGVQTYMVEVAIGPNLPEGPAVYFAREVPRCTWLQRMFPVAIDYPPVTFNVSHSQS